MFDEIRFSKIERLPNYVFAEVNAIKMAARRAGEDIIDFSMGNPDGRTPQHIIDKLCESAQKDKTHGYSVSQGIYKLRLACANWYKRKYGVILDPESEIVAVMGSKEGFVHLTSAIVNPGDVAVVPDPAYPIHTQAFIIAGGNVVKIPLAYDENLNFNENKFFIDLQKTFDESIPRPKYVVVNFPHNPTTVVVQKSFYERLVAMARQERFYIISDIAYAEIAFDGYKTPSIFEVQGAKDVAVEAYTLSKSYNMAGWRVGFVSGNKKLVAALAESLPSIATTTFAELYPLYKKYLFCLGKTSTFRSAQGIEFQGVIQGVQPDGRLVVAHAQGTVQTYTLKELQLCY
mgnify:CR=1 FL=1